MPSGIHMLGRKLSEEHRRNISLGLRNNKNHLGKKFSKETKRLMSLHRRGKKLTPEHIRKALRRREKSSLEIKTQQIIDKNNLPYKFVGNGEFLIERKNPDFINTNGQKIAVEVYYRRHKELLREGLEKWKKERELIFNNYGWQLFFFDETQVNEEHLLKYL